jgi:hypothetical protein
MYIIKNWEIFPLYAELNTGEGESKLVLCAQTQSCYLKSYYQSAHLSFCNALFALLRFGYLRIYSKETELTRIIKYQGNVAGTPISTERDGKR